MNAPELLDRIASLVFLPRCAICQAVTAYDDVLCGKCGYDSNTDDAGAKVFRSGAADAVAAMVYDERAAKALISYKRYGDRRATAFFCREIFYRMIENWDRTAFNIAVPVPMSKKSRRGRGFNQAELLARGLAGLTGAELRTDMLKRLDGSLPQHTLSREDRMENASISYVRGNMDGIEGKYILLVDDIITTGATACACAALLREAGAASVYVAAVASSE